MAGHLFVVQGDLTRLSCDAWLLPTDERFSIRESFARGIDFEQVAGRQWQRAYLLPLTPEPPEREPWVWLGNIGRSGEKSASWYVGRGVEFIDTVADRLSATQTSPGRRLVAVNVLGTGHGGVAAETGEVHRDLMPALADAAQRNGVDIALVTWGSQAYSAAQRVRRQMLDEGTLAAEAWAELPKNAHDAIPELARRASLGELVLFLGAGVSAAAGLPVWQELIDDMARKANIDDDGLARLHDFDLRDQAAVLARRRGIPDADFRNEVVERLRASHYSLSHGLLASLGARESVTTNYDELFEMACASGEGEPMAVLPYQGVQGAERWLLKLHGSVHRGDDITLTRDDYQALAQKYGALFGLVQAMLLTRHMLFVGYSLSDEDFHSVVREVRTARSGMKDVGQFGTVVALFENPLFRDLWHGDLDVKSLAPYPTGGPEKGDFAMAGRRLELFLDRLCLESATLDRFLLDPAYEGVLDGGDSSGDEHALRDAVLELRGRLAAAGDAPGWVKVQRLVKDFGG